MGPDEGTFEPAGGQKRMILHYENFVQRLQVLH
jgi:hypothetical protein